MVDDLLCLLGCNVGLQSTTIRATAHPVDDQLEIAPIGLRGDIVGVHGELSDHPEHQANVIVGDVGPKVSLGDGAITQPLAYLHECVTLRADESLRLHGKSHLAEPEIRGQDLGTAHQHLAQPIPGPLGVQCTGDPFPHLGYGVGQRLNQQCLAVREAPVYGSDSDAGMAGNLVEPHSETLGRDDVAGGGDDPVAISGGIAA